MNKHLIHSLALIGGLAMGQGANAAPTAFGKPELPANTLIRNIESDCFAVGQDKAAELGGTLAKAKPDTDGGVPVCRLVIVVPGEAGERPKRVEVVVPQ